MTTKRVEEMGWHDLWYEYQRIRTANRDEILPEREFAGEILARLRGYEAAMKELDTSRVGPILWATGYAEAVRNIRLAISAARKS